jgi:hypothetical protein
MLNCDFLKIDFKVLMLCVEIIIALKIILRLIIRSPFLELLIFQNMIIILCNSFEYFEQHVLPYHE